MESLDPEHATFHRKKVCTTIETASSDAVSRVLPWFLPARQSHGLDATPLTN